MLIPPLRNRMKSSLELRNFCGKKKKKVVSKDQISSGKRILIFFLIAKWHLTLKLFIYL